jgi:hypothetical protein
VPLSRIQLGGKALEMDVICELRLGEAPPEHTQEMFDHVQESPPKDAKTTPYLRAQPK